MPSPDQLSTSKSELRKHLRAMRQALSDRQQREASQNLSKRLKSSLALLRSRHIALYIASDGEISISHLIAELNNMGFLTYLPVITDYAHKKMAFTKVNKHSHYTTNKYGILEPSIVHPPVNKLLLGTVLTPLVGFDVNLNRLGMGGGYYDRYFDRKRWPLRSKWPTFIGTAHERQKVDSIPRTETDIPLDMVVTDQHIYKA